MKRFFYLLLLSGSVLIFNFCGKKGPILSPLYYIPNTVESWQVFQRGDKIILKWENPSTYTDGTPIEEIDEIEVWQSEIKLEPGQVDLESSEGEERTLPQMSLIEFRKSAKLMEIIENEEFSNYQKKKDEDSEEFEYLIKLSEARMTLTRLTFSIRIRENEAVSEFSRLISIEPGIFPLPPQEILASHNADRIEITWKAPERNIDNSAPANVKGYYIYRKGEDDLEARRLNYYVIEDTKYDDTNFLFDTEYHYFVRACQSEGYSNKESDDSETVTILPEDTFPPAVPSGLISIAGETFIVLSWNANQEKDLLGYRIWRKKGDEKDFILLTTDQPVRENVYRDSEVEKNRRYYYAITAQDINGNESEKSGIISEIIEKGKESQ